MTYKGYSGVTTVDEETEELHGRVIGLRDVITFVGRTVAEARRAFEESVDFYLKRCEETGKKPDKPFSGRFLVQVDPETHRVLDVLAEISQQTLNDVVGKALADFATANRRWVSVELSAPVSPSGDPSQEEKAHRRAAREAAKLKEVREATAKRAGKAG